MNSLTVEQVLSKISNQEPFEGTLEDNSLKIKIAKYEPYICTAIHHGHQFRDELIEVCNLSENERYHEEDAYTGDMIKFAPIQLIAQDSRYEYDLNRNSKECIYSNVWGANVWNRDLSESERERSLQKHGQFYTICHALIEKLLEVHDDFCVVFDIHSYNVADRNYVEPPVFNLGTNFVNKEKFGHLTDAWLSELAKIQLPGIAVEAKENDVFFGKGYLAESASQKYPNCLVLATEIKKIYADEFVPKPFVEIITALESGLEKAVHNFKHTISRR